MGDWPNREDNWGMGWTISPQHPLSLGVAAYRLCGSGGLTSTAWPAANRAILIPFRLPKPATVYKATVGCGATAAGNFDVGVYDEAGNRLVSGGSTGKAAAAEVNVDLTDTFLGQGFYYMALSADGTNNYVALSSAASVYAFKAAGIRQASSAFVLPASITFETVASAFLPVLQLRFRSY